jgi:hypothetical protein
MHKPTEAFLLGKNLHQPHGNLSAGRGNEVASIRALAQANKSCLPLYIEFFENLKYKCCNRKVKCQAVSAWEILEQTGG